MSRTNRRGGGGKSPVKKYVEISGGTGHIKYYDKVASEEVELDTLSMILLDEKIGVTGYNGGTKTQFSSNLIVDQSEEELIVKAYQNKKGTEFARGLWADIKEEVTNAKGKFTKVLYGLCDFGEGLELTVVKLSGTNLGSWIEFVNEGERDSEYDQLITFNKGKLYKMDGDERVPVTAKEEKALDAKLKKNPRAPRPVWFYTVNIEGSELSEEDIELAEAEDKKLQEYFEGQSTNDSGKSKENKPELKDAPTAPEGAEEEEEDDLPF